MEIEILIPTMNNQDQIFLLESMNVQSNAIICNQSSSFTFSDFTFRGKKIKCFSFVEKGVGLNRNNALMRAEGDYCIIADDDLKYHDNYEEKIRRIVKENPYADVIIFNLEEKKNTRFVTKNKFKVSYKNFMRFGAARIVIKRDSIIKANIFFNLNFGGGTKFSAGEDTLFLFECLRKGLKIIAVPESLAELNDDRESTWFKGYNRKYFEDRGALFEAISPFFSVLMSIQFLIRHRKMFENDVNIKDAFKHMLSGINEYRKW